MQANNGYCQVKEIESKGVKVADNNLKEGKVISLGQVPTVEYNQWPFGEGDKVLFDTNKSLKHGEFWYLKAESIFAFDNK